VQWRIVFMLRGMTTRSFMEIFARRFRLVAIAGLLFQSDPGHGAQAVFSKDGSKIYIKGQFGFKPGEVEVIDLDTKTKRKVVIPGLDGERVLDLDRTDSGTLIVLTGSGLHSWDGGKEVRLASGPKLADEAEPADKTQPDYWKDRVFSLPFGLYPFVRIDHLGLSRVYWIGFPDQWAKTPGRALRLHSTVVRDGWEAAKKFGDAVEAPWGQLSIAYNPADGIVCYKSDTISRWDANRGRMLLVSKERIVRFRGVDFDSDGTFYFGSGGDMWHGYIRIDGEETSMAAYRFAPLATFATSPGTSSQVGVESIAVAGPYLYVHLARMGGSGWGEVVRIAKAEIRLEDLRRDDLTFPIVYDLSKRLAIYQRALKSCKSLRSTGGWANLAASPDGKLVYFQARKKSGGGTCHWLVRDHGEPEELKLKKNE
jgi:hypothetical protein